MINTEVAEQLYCIIFLKTHQLFYRKLPFYHKLWPVTYEQLVPFSGQGRANCNIIKHTVQCFACHQLLSEFTAGIIDYRHHINLLINAYPISALMIRIESVLTFIIFSKFNDFYIDNVQQICQAKFDLARQMLGKCSVTGHYHQHCIQQPGDKLLENNKPPGHNLRYIQ